MESKNTIEEDWLFEIKPKNNFFSFNYKEVFHYKDLMLLFVKRDIVTLYKQTILGPLWYVIQPLFTSVIFTLIFNNVAGIQTGKTPAFLFNLAGVMVWSYFTACLNDTSDTFKKNASLFEKVYFPRIIVPLSIVISNLVKFVIQFVIFVCFYVFYVLKGMETHLTATVLFFPLLIILMGFLGLGLGMIISSLVTKYRDLSYLVGFGVQLLMYLSAVMYPMSLLQQKLPTVGWLIAYNPLAYIIESARYLLLKEGTLSGLGITYTIIITFFTLVFGILIFNKTEKSFIDTV